MHLKIFLDYQNSEAGSNLVAFDSEKVEPGQLKRGVTAKELPLGSGRDAECLTSPRHVRRMPVVRIRPHSDTHLIYITGSRDSGSGAMASSATPSFYSTPGFSPYWPHPGYYLIYTTGRQDSAMANPPHPIFPNREPRGPGFG
jgi:hypothetical protein